MYLRAEHHSRCEADLLRLAVDDSAVRCGRDVQWQVLSGALHRVERDHVVSALLGLDGRLALRVEGHIDDLCNDRHLLGEQLRRRLESDGHGVLRIGANESCARFKREDAFEWVWHLLGELEPHVLRAVVGDLEIDSDLASDHDLPELQVVRRRWCRLHGWLLVGAGSDGPTGAPHFRQIPTDFVAVAFAHHLDVHVLEGLIAQRADAQIGLPLADGPGVEAHLEGLLLAPAE
mmetsp:Transcript_79957/g.259098  ORF Transcript_79957/g.259098 Transcript_79957/m.259098 type:complete len:233 (-) Transcript_79957:6790-7488(-)